MSEPPIISSNASHQVRLEGGRAQARAAQPRAQRDGTAAASSDVAHIPAVAQLGARLDTGTAEATGAASRVPGLDSGAVSREPGRQPATPTRPDTASGAVDETSPHPIDYTLPQALRARMDKLRIVNAAVRALVSGLPRVAAPPSAEHDEMSANRSSISSAKDFSR
jgi:hypothetical protein